MGPPTMAERDPRPTAPRPAPSAPAPLLVQMTRGYLWVCTLSCVASAVLMAATLWRLPQGAALAALFGVLALAAGTATRLPEPRLGAALTALLAALTVSIGITTLTLGWGLAAPGLPVTGLMICVLCAAAGWRAGAALAAVAALVVLAVAVLAPPQAAIPSVPTTALQLGTLLITIGSGLACGVMISKVMARYVRSANEREQRFRRLLALAADAYWEIDHEYRLMAAADQSGEMRPLKPEGGLGAVPWELPRFACDPDTLDGLQADMDARLPFRDLPVRWTGASGSARAYLVSGEPRFDERGIFTGYWGVARDVTAVHAAQDALAATETRYQELFTRIPTPLLLHRGGRVLDANPAALHLLGHADLQTLLGSDVLAAYQSGDSRERARRRVESLDHAELGTALAVTDFRLEVQGRVIPVRATGVRVQAEGGPALLAIYIDDSERLAAEEAVRRSEALLSHLVATSPDLITLTDMSSGRYAMVNHAFERVTGWAAAEAVGRTSLELGVWASAAERDRFVAELREQGSVSNLSTPFITKQGRVVAMVVSAARFVMDQREYMVINARDVTDKERERLQREAILANASIGIAVTHERRFVLANRHFEHIFGWPAGQLVGQPRTVVWMSEAEHAEVGALMKPALARGEPVELERLVRRHDGSSFIARIRGRAIDPARPADNGTVWIVEDVTERRQFEQALATARDDAEAANRAKSAFLANTSHELRTPLNGMIGLARMARDEGVAEERRRQYLDQIAQSAQSLADIISDILDLSKIEAGKLQIETIGFDLGAELQALQRTYAPLAQAQGLTLRFEVAAEAAGAVMGDPLRLRQIMGNFLANAIKFTATGWVAVVAQRPGGAQGRVVRLEVRDSGPGIDPATSERLFQPFTQADQSTTRRYGGTGLGLSICHELATLMGGAVGVDSRVGAGSTFWAELPLPCSSTPVVAAPAGVDLARLEALRGTRVLMAEDNTVNMMIAVALLERWGVVVTQAQDGQEALAAVQGAAAAALPFHAVLMDVQMPVMSGHEATQALRRAGQTLPIIALTAAALVTERDAALQAGMNDFLTKPIDAEKLQAALLRWCAPAA